MELVLPDRLNTLISLEDLEIVSDVVMRRSATSELESERVERIRELLWAASVLTRALSTHMQHSLIDCCGTLGTNDLAADTLDLHRALVRYGQLVKSVAAEYRHTVRPGDDALPLYVDRATRSISAEVA